MQLHQKHQMMKKPIPDDSRIVAALPTIKHLVAQGAKVILTSHLGRPKGEPNAAYSLAPVAEVLAAHLGQSVTFIEDCVGAEVEAEVAKLTDGEVALLERCAQSDFKVPKDGSCLKL